MFDLSNLNDYEFETLCRDIMCEVLDTELHMFSRGADGGIDVCDSKIDPDIVIQAKHYCGSTYSNLRTSLHKEVEKVKKLNPESYYVFTSLPLTRKNKLEIIEMFSEYMKDISYVLDKTDIDRFLEKPETKDIVYKNYKLWLSAANVLPLVTNQNVFIDCEELMMDIENQVPFFVDTDAYMDSIRKLSNNNILIIVGAPGVGKSTISKMLVLYYASKSYTVRYVSNNSIAELKRVISIDRDKKEIILLDDFLGQHYMNLRESQPSELKTLIALIERSKSKKLILNSRITILNEAVQSSIVLREMMERHDRNKYLIDLDRMSVYEKAKILYNHLYFNYVPREYLASIKINRN